jgi:hypothetical protein
MSQLDLLCSGGSEGLILQDGKKFRHTLYREFDSTLPAVLFVMLNPSIADAHTNDPTVRKTIGFAKRWGFGRVNVANLYDFRATDPRELRKHDYPKSERCDEVIFELAMHSERVVVAWGANAPWPRAHDVVNHVLRGFQLWSIGKLTAGGQPKHPLMLAYELPLLPLARFPPEKFCGVCDAWPRRPGEPGPHHPACPVEHPEMPTASCPKCRVETSDFDGFGFVYCFACRNCSHYSRTGPTFRCDLCGAPQTGSHGSYQKQARP